MISEESNLFDIAINVSQQGKQVTCLECCKYYIAPETAACGHSLCHGCWSGRRSCPVCAAQVTRKALKLNKPLQKLTEHTQLMIDGFQKYFNITLNEFQLHMIESKMEVDPAKHVKDWLASSQNHFSAPLMSSEQSARDVTNSVELSASKVLIHEHNKITEPIKDDHNKPKSPPSKISVLAPQEDWDKIEVCPDSEDIFSKNKENIAGPMDIEPFSISDNEFTADNPRRSSRKKETNNDVLFQTHNPIDRLSPKKLSSDTEKMSNKSKQNWNNVKKMSKEFSKLNKKNRNKLNVSIEMCKKTQNVNKPNTLTSTVEQASEPPSVYIIDENTPNVASNIKETVTKSSPDKLRMTCDDQNGILIDNTVNKNSKCTDGSYKSADENKTPTNRQSKEGSTITEGTNVGNENIGKNIGTDNLPRSNKANHNDIPVPRNIETKTFHMPFYKRSNLHLPKTTTENDVKITQKEIDSNAQIVNSDDIEISIRVGFTVTNIVIKKKENNVELKVNTDRQVQTSLGPHVLPNQKDATCSPMKKDDVPNIEPDLVSGNKISKKTPVSKSMSTKKNTDSADTATANFEITESVEKELSDLMEYVETGGKNTKSSPIKTIVNSSQVKETKVPDKPNEVIDDEHANDLDIFESDSINEVDLHLLKNAKHAPSEIMMSTLKNKKSQKVADKRDRENEDTALPRNKKQKIDYDEIQEVPMDVSLQEQGTDVGNCSENMNYDAIMSQVFANIDADIQDKNTQNKQPIQNTVKPKHTQSIIISQNTHKPHNTVSVGEKGNTSKELINQKDSENIFSMIDKDSESTDITAKEKNQFPVPDSTQDHIKNLLTPGMCQNLASSLRNDDAISVESMVIEPDLGTPMMDDDSDKSIVEETPQKNLSFSKIKQKADAPHSADKKDSVVEKDTVILRNETSDSQIIKSIINISDTVDDGTKGRDTTVLDRKKSNETPLTINKFIDRIKHNSTPMVRKSLNFANENLEDPEVTLCPTTTSTKESQEHTLCPTTTQEREFLAKAFEQTPKSPAEKTLGLRNSNRNNKKLCLAGSCISVLEQSKIKRLCLKHNWTFVDKYTKDVTHLIVSVDGENKSQRSVKYMCALAASKWIISYAWVEKCLQLNEYVDELPYEVLDACGDNGPRRSRLAKRRLFNGFTFYCMPPFSILNVDNLKYILEASGGRVVEDIRLVKVTPNCSPALLVAEPEQTQEDKFIYLAMELNIVPLNYEWVLNCLGTYSLGSMHDLLLCPVTLLHPATNQWPPSLLLRDTDDN